MTPVVIDSSVLIATAFVEPYSAQAAALFRSLVHGGHSFHAPILIHYELVTVIRKAVHFGRITEAEGRHYKDRLLATRLTTHVNVDLINRAYDLAKAFNLPKAYDTQYLAVADSLNCEFWTGDERLYNSVRAAFPLIRWLGTIEV